MRCANLGIRSKIIGTNLLILLLLLTLAGTVWIALDRIGDSSGSAIQGMALQKELLQREIDHLKWGQQLILFVSDPAKTKLDIQTDDHQCAFGTWYFGPSRQDAERIFPSIRQDLDAIKDPHAKLHQSGSKIIQLKAAGDTATVQNILSEETLPSLKDVQTRLGLLRDAISRQNDQSTTDLLAQFSSTHRTVVAVSLSALICGLLASILSARSLTRPIRELVAFSDAVAHGDFEQKLTIDCKDELGVLARSLQTTVAIIHDQLAFNKGMLQGLTVPCSIFSKEDTTIFTNRLMLDLIERDGTPEDYYGQKSGQYIWSDASKDTLSTVALRENRSLTAEREFTTHKGNKRHVAISSSPFTNQRGEILGTISVWIDMTDIVNQNILVRDQNASILETADKLQEVVGIVSSAAEQLSAQVEQSSRGARQQAHRMTETATAMEEMTSTVVEVARNAAQAASTTDSARQKAQHGATVVDAVVQGIRAVQTQALGLKEEMTALGAQAEGIGRIINVISDIADQTNLLALNAAIEAARAGDAGRGFAVVADEVRKLAEKTMAATQEVVSTIRAIQQGTQVNIGHVDHAARSIEEATLLANDSGAALQEIVRLVEAASDQVRAIATASEEQSATTEEINRSVEEVNRVSLETSQAMDQASGAVMDLARQAQVLHALSTSMQTHAA